MMEVQKLSFVGTAKEFALVKHLFAGADAEVIDADGAQDVASAAETDGAAEVIRDVIRRRPVPSGQRELYEALSRAGDRGLLKPELAETMGRRDKQIDGVLGALGKRIFGTKGTGDRGILLFLDIRSAEGTWNYRLRPEVREILKEEGLI